MGCVLAVGLCLLSWQGGERPPTVQQRTAIAERFYAADQLVKGGRVQARWLQDGARFLYRTSDGEWQVDPARGEKRRATGADRAAWKPSPSPWRGGRLHAPVGGRSVGVAGNGLLAHAEGEEATTLSTEVGERWNWQLDPRGWSSDGARLAVVQLDLKEVNQLPIVDYLSAVEQLRTVPYVKAGSALPRMRLHLFDLAAGTTEVVDSSKEDEHYLFGIGWTLRGREFLYLRLTRTADQLELRAADPASGATRVVLSERSDTFIGGLDFLTGGWQTRFTRIAGADEFLWIHERDGWRQLELRAADGSLIRPLTRGAFPVQEVVGVDLAAGWVYLLANAEERLYDTHFYRVPLAGGELERLSEGDGEHHIQMAPGRRYFLDTHSALQRPPVTELRAADGRLLMTLDTADITELEVLGWTPPLAFTATAADGVTALHGALFRPYDFDPIRRYPVVDLIYSGPFMTIVPNEFNLAAPHTRRARTLAQLGFIVVLLDPRGTTERGKKFQDASFHRIGQIEIDDHVTALRQVAQSRPWMDLERVGVYGFSWGGYFALRAMLTAPEFFRAGVAGAPGEMTEAAMINEPYMGTPQQNPQGYAAGLNAPLAEQLEGALLLIHGTADVNAPFSTTMRMVDALIRADKDFELLVLPGADHSMRGVQGAYAMRRIGEFLVAELQATQSK